eukprot:8901118-Heterocapsa_arctica.AAC.1
MPKGQHALMLSPARSHSCRVQIDPPVYPSLQITTRALSLHRQVQAGPRAPPPPQRHWTANAVRGKNK